jgi:hypothetical protein
VPFFKAAKSGAGSTLTVAIGPLRGRNVRHKCATFLRSVVLFSSGTMDATV